MSPAVESGAPAGASPVRPAGFDPSGVSADDTCTNDTSFARPSASRPGSASTSSSPAPVMGRKRSVTSRSAASRCHGTRFEWCSIGVSTIASPGFSVERAHACATRLIASVELRVNTISRGLAACTNAAKRRRASSYRAVASSAMRYTPRWMFALHVR